MMPTAVVQTGVPLQYADELIVLLRSEDQAVQTEKLIVEIADRLEIPLSGTWHRLDASLEGEAGITHDSIRLYVKPAAPAPESSWSLFPEQVSLLPGVEAVFTWLFTEAAEGVVSEGYFEFVGGKLAATHEVDWTEDPQLHAIATGAERDAYVWTNYPLSKLARRVGLAARPNWARWVANNLGRVRPIESEPDAAPLGIYLPVEMAKAVHASASAQGVSVSKLLCDLVMQLGQSRLNALGHEPEVYGDKAKVTLYLPKDVLSLIGVAAMEADCSLSHIFQQTWLAGNMSK